jgi:hypothetical protein
VKSAIAAIALIFTVLLICGSAKRKPLTFELAMMAELIDQAGTDAGFRTAHSHEVNLGANTYTSSSGESLSLVYGNFVTEKEANRYFDWQLGRSARVTSKGVKKNRLGKVVGQRAEVLIKEDPQQWEVMWTNEATFRAARGATLVDAVELERQYGE